MFKDLVPLRFKNQSLNAKGKGKGKVHPITGHEGPEGA